MSRGPVTFRQRDLTRAIKGAKAAGVGVTRVVIDKEGRIIVEMANGEGEIAAERNEWDEVMRADDGAH